MLSINISSTCHHNMVNFGPLTAEICWRVWGTPANFNRLRVLASLLHRRHSTEVNKTLQDVWPSAGTLYIQWLPPPNGILRSSLVLSYIASVTARHSSSGRQPNFLTWYEEWNYRTFAEDSTYIRLGGHHVASVHILVLK